MRLDGEVSTDEIRQALGMSRLFSDPSIILYFDR